MFKLWYRCWNNLASSASKHPQQIVLNYKCLRVSLVAQLIRIYLQCRRPRFDSLVGKISWRRNRLPVFLGYPAFLGFPGGSDGKESAGNVGDLGSIPGLGRSPGGRSWQPTPVFCISANSLLKAIWAFSTMLLKTLPASVRFNR